MIPDRPITPDEAMLPKYLDKSLLSTPAIALETVRMELSRLGARVSEMVSAIMPAAITGSRDELERVAAMDKVVDALHIAIIHFLGQISLVKLSTRQSDELMNLVEVANDLEHIGDRIATGMVTSAHKRIDEDVNVSPETAEVLIEYHAVVLETLDGALKSVAKQKPKLAKRVRGRKKDFSQLSRSIAAHGFDRLTADAPNRLKTYAREMEVVELLEGVFTIARRIARTQIKTTSD